MMKYPLKTQKRALAAFIVFIVFSISLSCSSAPAVMGEVPVSSIRVLLAIIILVVFVQTLRMHIHQRTRELKQALEDLQKSEHKYREFFNATTEAIFIHAPDGRLLHVNKPMLRMYGYESEEEVLSRNVAGLSADIPPYTQFDVQERIRKALEEGPQVFEWLAKRKDGETFWTEVSMRSSQISGEGQVLAVVREITKRKRAEEALRRSEAQYEQVISMISDVVWRYEVGAQGQFISSYISPVADRMLGLSPGTVAHSFEKYFSYIHPDDLQVVQETFVSALTARVQSATAEYRLCRPDGTILWARSSGLAYVQPNGNFVAYGTTSDITRSKQAEEALRDSESMLREAQVIADLGSYVLDFVSGMWKSSVVLDKIFGIDESYIRSVEGWSKLIHPDHRQEMTEYLANEVMGGRIRFNREYRIIRQNDKAERWVHGQGNLEIDSQNRLVKMHGVIRDITERKQAEDEMRHRVMELEMLYESGLTINRLLDPKEIGQKVIELLGQRLGWHHTRVRLYHPQDESLELLAFNQPGIKSEGERREIEERFKSRITNSTQGMTGWAVQHKQIVRSSDLQKDPRYIEAYPGLQSGLYVPMLIGERVVGVISIESERPDAFNSADERLTATLANQAASALENARLFEAERKQQQVSVALRDALSAGASMSTSLDFEAILDRLLETLERVVPFEGGSIMLVQPGTRKANIKKVRGHKNLDEQVTAGIMKYNFDIDSVENLRWMFQNKQPLVIPNLAQYPQWIQFEETRFICSWVGAPIIVNDEVIAFFSLDSSEPYFFTNEHAELMRAFTGQASLALQNARLFQETERRAREFATLYETSNTFAAENELKSMLQRIVEHTKKLLDSSSSGMYLHNAETNELELVVDTTPYAIIGIRLKSGEGVAGYVAKNRQALRLDDYSTWENRSLQYENTLFHAVLGVPMLYGGELTGVLMAGETGNSARKFSQADEHLLSLFASQAAGAIHSARLREQTARRLEQLQALHTIDRAISSSFDLHPILNTVINQSIAQLHVDAVDILLFHPSLQTLEFVAGHGFRTRAIEKTRLRLGKCFSGRAALERRTIHSTSLPEIGDGFTRADVLKAEDFWELYAVPLIAKGEIKGVLEVFNRSALPQNTEWIDFLETLAGQAAIAIDQAQLFEDLQRANLELVIAYDATIEGWARAMDLRDKETEMHTERVTELTLSLARALGIKDSEILHIRRGALLHDIGKIGVPDGILLKEGKLTEEEWDFMRRHPKFAYEMLQPIKYLRQALDIPYCHHEKWDGTGYPRGLREEQIPLAARIFAIADVWDALTSDRPYRKAWTEQEALDYIREQSGKQFDPRVVAAFLKTFGHEK